MITFNKLRWKNFLSTGNVYTEVQLDQVNTTLIVGENGAGKSTMLDALMFSLFGKPFRKINKPQLVNSITQKNAVVEIEFVINSTPYKIIRGLKPNLFEVYRNDTLLNQSAEMKDYQEILEKQILKINYKSFCQVVVLGSATFQPFMQLTAAQRREVIEDILDLKIFTTMNQLLKNKVADNNEQVVGVEYEQKMINEKIRLIKEHMLETQNNNEQLIEEKSQLVDETIQKIETSNDKVEQLDKQIEQLSEEICDEQTLNKKVDKIKKLKIQLEQKVNTYRSDISFLQENENCPVCNQNIDHEFKCETIDKKNVQINDIESNIPALMEQYNDACSKLEQIVTTKSKITDIRMEQHQIKTRVSSWLDYVEKLQAEMNSIIEKSQTNDDAKITDLEVEMEDFEDRYNRLQEQKSVLYAASILLKDGGIKAKIIKQYVPIINKLISKYLSAMDFFVQFELDEEFKETIKSRFRDDFSYDSFSEGEKMRINLSILFAWRSVAKLRNSINTNLLIMDEVFDSSLDANGTEEFMKIINQLTVGTNTFIISHKTDQLIDKFSNVLRFEKHKNFSRIV